VPALAGAAVGALVAALVFAPASWLTARVERASGGRVQLMQPQGTVWNGSAELVLTGGAGSRAALALPGAVRWKLRPDWRGLRAQVDADCCTPQPLRLQFSPRWGGGRLMLADGRSQWPATLLAGLGTPWNTVQPEGALVLSTKGLSVEWVKGRLTLAGQARLDANGLSSRLSTLKPMGSYRLTLDGGVTPHLRLETLDGSLQLAGSGEWAGSNWRFRGVAQAAPDRAAALSNLLNIIGRRDGERSIITIG
jgi:general secretion pathway protein N